VLVDRRRFAISRSTTQQHRWHGWSMPYGAVA
jgi:hypothetical protein